MNTQDRIAAQQAQEVRDHQFRLMLREWKEHLNLSVLVALLGTSLYVAFFGIQHVEVAARRLVFLIPVFAVGALMLVSREWVENNIGRHIKGPSLDMVKQINDSSMAVPAVVMLVSAVLYVLGLGVLVKLVTFLALVGFVGFNLPPVTDWLAQEPDLSHFKATSPARKPDPKSFSDDTEVVDVVDVDVATENAAQTDVPAPTTGNASVVSDEPVELKNPDLTEAEQQLAEAKVKLADFQKQDVPKDAEERRAHNRQLAGKKSSVTRLSKKVSTLGGDHDSVS